MLNEDVLSWLGNFINFLILVYLSLSVVKTECFNMAQLIITVFGLIISIAINIYTSINHK
jgi:hypothetical protein